MNIIEKVTERFLRYVAIDTQSIEESKSYPSTEKQKELGKLLVKELKELGLSDAEMDEYGYVMATLNSNSSNSLPTIGFIAHMDTSPDVSGKNVKPIFHRNYDGGKLSLSENVFLSPELDPELKENIGRTIITSDGTTLLGADDKAGIAEIMTALEYLIQNPQIKRPRIRVAFTVDEEVGNGTKYFDVKKFGADFAYTIDGGGKEGEIENETFSADSAKVTFSGKNVHPGYAKNKMINSIKAASLFVQMLPKEKSPETTEKKEGFLHPISIEGSVESTTIRLILRSFETSELTQQRSLIERICRNVEEKFPGLKTKAEFEESYRNMKLVLDKVPKVVDLATKAAKKSGITPTLNRVRGGTDGSRLSFMGLPTPNIFTGGHLYHSRYEWVAVEVMELAVNTLVNLIELWGKE